MRRIKGTIIGAAVSCMAALMAVGSGLKLPGSKADTVYADEIQPVMINETNFPDANFRSVISTADYDRDGNGILDAEEIKLIRNIYCDNKGIKSLQGIEYFVELQGLYCTFNEIETWDLSNNKELRGVWCSNNKFTSLDFTPNPELMWVYCYECNLTSLNVANNPKMAFIECNTNPLATLDVTHNPELEHLTCGSCELTTLDLSNNPKLAHLDAFRNHFTTLDVTKCPKMKRLDIWDNPGLGSIDVSKCPGLQYYNCANNKVSSLDVSQNPQLQKLICSYNQITSLDVTHNPKLVYLDCACNQLSSLDISHNPYLYFLQAFTNSFTKLNIGNNPFLVKTYEEGVKKDESAVCKGHSWTIDYGGDTSTGGDNIYFLCFDDKVTLSTEADDSALELDEDDSEYNSTKNGEYVTRAMVVQTLYNMAGKPSVKGLTTRFTDVEEGAWYEDAVKWGEKNNICIGYPYVSSDKFGVGKWIKRQDLVFMLMRYSELMGYKRAIDFGRSDDYIDYFDIDYYAWEAVCWSATWNIMEGKGAPGASKEEQRIEPKGKVTRAELETIIKRLLEVNGVSMTKIPVPDNIDLPPEPARDKNDISPDNPARLKDIEKLIQNKKDEKDIKGSTFSILMAKGTAKSKNTVKLSWKSVPGAGKYVIYGTKCGKKNKYKYIKTVKGNSCTINKLKKETQYKYVVAAVKGSKVYAVSKTVHVTTAGGNTGNYNKVKLNKKSLSLKKGKSGKIKATLKHDKSKVNIHRKLAWESDNIKVAKVKNGKVTAVGKGKCYVYAYTQNGVYAKVKVTVK